MKTSRYPEAQIIAILRQAEGGADLPRNYSASLTGYFASKEQRNGIITTYPKVPRRNGSYALTSGLSRKYTTRIAVRETVPA